MTDMMGWNQFLIALRKDPELARRCEYGKSHPKFAIAIGPIDYSTPTTHLKPAVAAAKRHRKFREAL